MQGPHRHAMSYIRDLLAEARTGDPVAAEELAHFVEHVLETPLRGVGIAFGLSDREVGGDEFAARDRLYRQLDNFLADGLSLRQRAEAIRRKRNRYVPRRSDEGAEGERRVLWELHRIGARDLSERQVRRIL